ncbi:MAG: DUF1430 domain-containing protein [Defluviitaleaceae bacterium]|nr:DUF1430 domain-containing protein [Defluviitaleaceae bacterium]
MKKIMSLLFSLQLCVLVFYGVFLLLSEPYLTLFQPGIEVEVSFGNDIDNFHLFIDALYETEQLVISPRALDMQGNVTHIYTTDVTLGGEVVLSSGRFPAPETAEFIHSHETGDENQVGVIDDILPGHVFSITHFSNPFNFMMDGNYFFQTGDMENVKTFVDQVESYVVGISVFDVGLVESNMWDGLIMVLGMSGMWEMIGLSLIFLLSMFLLILQHGILIIKKQTIFKLHGVSERKVLKNVTQSVLVPLLIGGMIGYFISVIYVYVVRFQLFLIDITRYFVIMSGTLILLYLFLLNLFVYGYLRFSNRSHTIKGGKSYKLPQLFNHVLKVFFSMLLLLSLPITLDAIHALQVRLAARSLWEESEGIFRIHFGATGYWSTETEMLITDNVRKMYDYLSEHHGGFLIDGWQLDNILERGFSPYVDPEEAPALQLSPIGHRITASPSFLEVNPIQAANGIGIEEQLILEPTVQNVLVPYSLKLYEEELYALYLEHFYFEKVQLYNTYAAEVGNPLTDITIDELSLNIIYINDEQCHFGFNALLMSSTGGLFCNPVVVIFNPDNAHGNLLFVSFQHSTYFRHDGHTQDAFESILPAIERYDLTENIRFVSSVYHEFIWVIQFLSRQLMRLVALLVLLLISSLAVTYYLMATYFETNKFKLVVKRNFGYHTLKRNKVFVLTFLSYSLPIILLGGWIFGWEIFLIGTAVLLVDIFVALILERRLMKKSFSEIMKGER